MTARALAHAQVRWPTCPLMLASARATRSAMVLPHVADAVAFNVPASDTPGVAADLPALLELRKRDIVEGRIEIGMRIAAQLGHRALRRDFAAQDAGMQIAQRGIAVRERIMGREIRDGRMGRRGVHVQPIAGQIAVQDD